MHMSDALVNPVVAGSMYACSAVVAGYSLKKINRQESNHQIPVMGVMGAFVFAAQMLNFSIPGTGASGHISGGILLAAILGPYAGFLTLIGILTIQCLLFADGGLLALGANIWNMAFYGCFIGALFFSNLFLKNNTTSRKITTASIIGSIIALQMGAFSVTIETLASGITDLPFRVFLLAMQPIHLAIGVVEGIITAAVLNFVFKARPELLWFVKKSHSEPQNHASKFSLKSVVLILFLAFIIMAGVFSNFASSNPDGLEWSIAKVLSPEEGTSLEPAPSITERIQDFTSLLPDYAFKNSPSEAGTSFSGIAGGLTVFALFVVIGLAIQLLKKKVKHERHT